MQDVGTKSGIYLCSDGEIRYFTNGELTSSGLIKDENDNYYYIRSSLVAVRGQEYWVTNTNGLIEQGSYYFAPDGRMVVDLGHGDNGELYTGLRTDADGETRYYMNGVPTYAGLMLINGSYYYFNSSKVAVRNCTYTITKTNGLKPEGEYTFDADGKMVETSSVMTLAATSSYQVWAPNITTTYNYVYNGDKLSQLTVGTETLNFTYDASGSPLSVIYDTDTTDSAAGTTYYYITNIQGDVIAIVNDSGTAVVEYTYDAWGNPIGEVSGTIATTLGTLNPLRYRSYVYDSETQYYYLQTRYYNPTVSRFINADALAATGQGLLGNNMLAYCNNNPLIFADTNGMCVHTVYEPWKPDCENCKNGYTVSVGLSASAGVGPLTIGVQFSVVTDCFGDSEFQISFATPDLVVSKYPSVKEMFEAIGTDSFKVGGSFMLNMSVTDAPMVENLHGASLVSGVYGAGLAVETSIMPNSTEGLPNYHGLSLSSGICTPGVGVVAYDTAVAIPVNYSVYELVRKSCNAMWGIYE